VGPLLPVAAHSLAELKEEAGDDGVMDAGLVASAQAVEHYEIARYGTLIAWANQLDMSDGASLFEESLRRL
jgi:ferritin-like metal-binding protein YciE